jgi:hypothetical protein
MLIAMSTLLAYTKSEMNNQKHQKYFKYYSITDKVRVYFIDKSNIFFIFEYLLRGYKYRMNKQDKIYNNLYYSSFQTLILN